MSRRLSDDCVIIAGGGIGGLAAALTLASDRRALRRLRSGPRDAPAGRRHQSATQCRARTLRPRYSPKPTSTASACRRKNGRWSGSMATTSIRSRAENARATTGRNMRCIAGCSTCCCTTRSWSGWARSRCRLGSRVAGYRQHADGSVSALRRTCRRLSLGAARRAA